MSQVIVTLRINAENDIVAARQRCRQIAAFLGFDAQDQTRLATAVSEIARNAFRYAGGGKAEFIVEGRTVPQLLVVRISDTGPGIEDLKSILEGTYRSATGMGLGILGAKRLMDHFEIESKAGKGAIVSLKKFMPRRTPLMDPQRISELSATLSQTRPGNLLEEVQRQNQELLRILEELRKRQDELAQLNHELEDTNRGVVALYAELDERANHLRRADEMKSRFLSNMSHEFRTPLNSILSLSRLLLDRLDGDLTQEQEKQLFYIRRSAEGLSDIVNDLLDLAKVEAGKITVNPAEFYIQNLFGALRGMLRPLIVGKSVNLVFEDASHLPALFTDEGKVSQILRNFISNSLKFTEQGEVRISATFQADDHVKFSVSDTGIGIAAEDQEAIFQEFAQIENPLQKRAKGTGLGLPLSRRLAELLGGAILLKSSVGQGSTFSAVIPRTYVQATEADPAVTVEPEPSRIPVLVVEDEAETRFLYEAFFRRTRYQMIPARTVHQARSAMRRFRPAAIILDLMLQGEDGWGLLAELKMQAETRDIPVIVVTTVADQRKAASLGVDLYAVKPVQREWLMAALARLTGARNRLNILLIDDDEVTRYLVKQSLHVISAEITETTSGEEGLDHVRQQRPDLIVLDLELPGLTGFQVLDELRADTSTSGIPVIIVTSRVLSADEARRLEDNRAPVLLKSQIGSWEYTDCFKDILMRVGLLDGEPDAGITAELELRK